MRIGVFLPEIEDFSEKNGGALARWVYEVYKQNHEHKVHIFCPMSNNPLHSGFITHPIKSFHEFDKKKLSLFNLGHHLKYNFYPFVSTVYSRLLGIHLFHVLNRYSYVLLIKKFNTKAKIILHMQNDHLLYLTDTEFRKVIKSTSLIIACSDYVRDGIRTRIQKELPHLKKMQVVTVYNGADISKFQIDESYAIRHAKQNILFIGRLIPEKGVLELIQAFILLIKNGNEKATLTIVGSENLKKNKTSEYIQKLKNECKCYEKRIIFTGLIENNRLPEYMKNASIFVCPSVWNEPFGMVITEAMSSGLPVVASNRGGIPEIIDGVGLIVDPENIESLSIALASVLGNLQYANQMAKKGLQRFKRKFSWEVIHTQMQEILSEQFNLDG